QDAHESIRPTDPTRRPEHIRKYLKEDQYRLYELIWQRFMASQMAPAIFDTTTIDFDFDRFLFRATGSVVKFDGYQRLYKESREAEEGKPLEEEQGLPVVQKGEDIHVKAITPSEHFTSHMETDLDKVEDGDVNWRKMLGDFYGPFAESVKGADIEALIGEAHDLSAIETERCPTCGGKLVPRGGFFGPFLACEKHPKDCKYTRPLRGDRKPPQPTNEICHECGAPMVIRHGRSGEFLG